MSKTLYRVAPTEETARQVVTKTQEVRTKFKKISVVDDRTEVERIAHPALEEFRNAVNGSIGGAAIGLLYGAATLMVIGAPYIPGVLGVCLILGYSALGGLMFGAIVGSTGLFAKKHS